MATYAKYRWLHMWVGIALLVPAVVVAATGILWNHERDLGLVSGYEKGPKGGTSLPPLRATAGTWSNHSAAIDQALAAARSEWGEEVIVEKIELRNDPGSGLVVKVRVPRDAGLATEEITWSVAEERVVSRRGVAEAKGDWSKVIHDLHTGKFFSTRFGFLWSDGVAAAVLLLGGSGLVMFFIPVWKKWARRRQARQARPAAQPASDLVTTP